MRELTLVRLGRLVRWPFRIITRGQWLPDAITIAYTVVYWVEPWPRLRAHEMTHVQQCRRYGVLVFWALYLGQLVWRGPFGNRFEVEARAAEEE